MSPKLLKLQLAGCALLSSVLLAEWGYGRYAQSDLQSLLDKQMVSDYQAEELPSLDMDALAAQNNSQIIERPLFIEGRKPLAEASPTANAEEAEVGQLDDWQLIGVYEKDQRLFALFSKLNEARTFLKLNQEQLIAGWQLREIQGDRVILQQGSQQKTVMLRKPRNTTPAPAAAPKQPAGRPTRPPRPTIPANPVAAPNNNTPETN